MKRILFLGIILAAIALTNCQRKTSQTAGGKLLNQKATSAEGEPMLVGKINRTGLQKEPYKIWFQENYERYQVDAATLQPMKDKLKNTDLLVFMGTWCSDSKREVPRLFKILDQIGYAEQKLQVVAVDNNPDRYKQSPQHEEKNWNIEYVPTIILIQNGKEIGRIVEMPQATLEKDLASFIGQIKS